MYILGFAARLSTPWLPNYAMVARRQPHVNITIGMWLYSNQILLIYRESVGQICMQVRKEQLELNMEQQLVPNRKKSTSRLYIVTLLI